MSDLQEKLSIPGELQNVRVLHSVSADPDIFFVVDEDAMLIVRPLVLLGGSAPTLDDVSRLVEFENRRRWNTAIGLGRIGCCVFVMIVQTARSRGDPEMIV